MSTNANNSASTSGAATDNKGGAGTNDANNNSGAAGTSASGGMGEIPWAFIDCPTDTLMLLISHMLNLLIQHNDQVVLTPDALTRFHSRAAPGISVLEYLRRIVKYTNMEKIPLLSLLAYIDITCQHLPNFTLSSLTVHRFLIAGVCAGSKAQCDVFCTNAHYAKVGGIKVQELNALEREFLKVTQWNLCCNADLLQRYYTSLIRSHGGYTQAAEPATPPFKAFPRSLSKPRSTSDDTDEDMSEEVEVDDTDESPEIEAAEAEGSKRRSLDVTGMIVDTVPEASPEALAGRGRVKRRSSAHRTSPRSAKAAISDESMDVDVEVDRDAQSTSPTSPATSSIPSSSRSSIRGTPHGRGRAVSMSFSDARPAEPQLDRTPISASPFRAGRLPHDQGPLTSQNKAHPPSTGEIEEDHEGDDHQHQQNQHHEEHHHHTPGAHLLKSLVGGIFHRRKSSHTADKPPPPQPAPAERKPSGPIAGGLTNGNHAVVSSQPIRQTSIPTLTSIKSPLPADLPPPPKPYATSTTAPNINASNAAMAVPAANNTSLGQAAPAVASRNNSLTRSPRSMKSPGMAKPVTPRIRTHEEFGEYPAEGGHVLTLEQGLADDGKRRARVE